VHSVQAQIVGLYFWNFSFDSVRNSAAPCFMGTQLNAQGSKAEIVKSEETSIARQLFGKHIPAATNTQQKKTSATTQRRCKQAFSTIGRLRFLRCPCRRAIKRTKKIVWVSWVSRCQSARISAWELRNWIESSLRNLQLQNNGKKGIRLWKEDFMCDFTWQWDLWIRCQETTSGECNRLKTLVCVTMTCKVWE
jgi:hypothetical protein